MPEFLAAADIGNRALQHCGARRMDPSLGFSEQSRNASEVAACYGKLRRAELRENPWRFAKRRAAIRAIDLNTLLLAPALWSPGGVYFKGCIVADATGTLWISRIPNNTNNDPTSGSNTWEPYFGPLTVALYDSTQAYFAGEVVYTAPGDGTYNVFVSLISANEVDPSLPNLWLATATYYQNQVVITYPAWSSAVTYAKGAAVTYTDGNTYASLIAGNVNNTPSSTSTAWALMPVLQLTTPSVPTMSPFQPPQTSPVIEWAVGTVYSIGSVVLFKGSQWVSLISNNSGNYPNAAASTAWAAVTGATPYMSLIDLNIDNNPALSPALWSGATVYASGAAVSGSDGVIYTSNVNSNVANNPTTDGGIHWTSTGILTPWTSVFTQGAGNSQWMQIGGAAFPFGVGLAELDIVYPIGAGPLSQTASRNAYMLPSGYLRRVQKDDKAGAISYLGVPGSPSYDDWSFEGDYLITWEFNPIVLPFIADVQDVSQMDDMFCEGLGCRIAEAVCETLTQSTEKLAGIRQDYVTFMGRARTANAIEIGWEDPPLDDFIACRM